MLPHQIAAEEVRQTGVVVNDQQNLRCNRSPNETRFPLSRTDLIKLKSAAHDNQKLQADFQVCSRQRSYRCVRFAAHCDRYDLNARLNVSDKGADVEFRSIE